MNPHESQESTEQKRETIKSTKNKKSSQKTTNKKFSKTGFKSSTEKQNSSQTIRKETNINIENPPKDTQIKHYENIGKQGMNIRVDIYKTKENVTRLEKDLELKNKKLEKVIKEKQNFQNYLTKLEKIVQEKTDTDNQDQNKILYLNQHIENKNQTRIKLYQIKKSKVKPKLNKLKKIIKFN